MVQVQGRLLPLTRPDATASPLVVHGLTIRYGSVTAVDDLRLAVQRGAIAGLVGPNGCGKTTTLRAIVGLAEPAAGTVTVGGFAAGSAGARSRVAWLPDEPSGLDELAVSEFLGLVRALYDADRAYDLRAAALLDAFDVADRRATRLCALSHGVRRIVAFVAAAALDTPLLVLDEATAALDPGAVLVLREVLRAHARRGRGVLLATQDLHFAASTCHTVTLLDHGRVVADGGVRDLLARHRAQSLEEVFVAALGRAPRMEEVRRALDAL